MMERWNPLKGHVGIITAFNFPCAVFFWNAALSLVCGNTNLWKPAETASLTAIACTKVRPKVPNPPSDSLAGSNPCSSRLRPSLVYLVPPPPLMLPGLVKKSASCGDSA